MSLRLPIIAGLGGINSAGRVSFHHAYRRMVIDVLDDAPSARTLQSLAALMGIETAITEPATRSRILDGTLIRRIENPAHQSIRWHQPLSPSSDGGGIFELARRQMPDPLPSGWQVVRQDDRTVTIRLTGEQVLYAETSRPLRVNSAGQLPTGFDPGALYQSRSHPRGLQITIFAASDALRSTGIDIETMKQTVPPDQFAVYSGSAMGQLDNDGYGGMFQNSLMGRRPTAKNVPLGLSEMPGDFINAYVLGSVGDTAGIIGACATFLYNLKQGAEAIQSGRKRVAVIGNAEAPIVPEVIEGYRTMGALAEDEALMALDGSSEPDHRRACRPFASNCGFTISESGVYAVLMDDELAVELGARVLGSVGGVFVNADGYKKSIPGPGIGNYLTMAKALSMARSILGEKTFKRGLHVQAHGTGTPQNRVTESMILSRLAGVFGIQALPVSAIKSYIGHSMAPAGGDQLASMLGTWHDGWLPGITTIDALADDVVTDNLDFALQHRELAPDQQVAALINSKGFGGNNATGLILSPARTTAMLERRWGRAKINGYKARLERVAQQAAEYDDAMCSKPQQSIYRFGEGVLEDPDIDIDDQQIRLPGFGQPMSLQVDTPFADMSIDEPEQR